MMMDPNSQTSALGQPQMLIPPLTASSTFPLSSTTSSTSSPLPTSLPSMLSPMPTLSCSSSSSSPPMLAAEHLQQQQEQQQQLHLKDLLQQEDLQPQNDQQQQQFEDLLQQHNDQQQQQLPPPHQSLQLEHLLQNDEQEQLLQQHQEHHQHTPEQHKAELEKLLEPEDVPNQLEIEARDLEQLLQPAPNQQASSSQASQQHQPLLQQLLQQPDQVQPGLELQPQPQLQQLLQQPSQPPPPKQGDPDKHPQEQLKQLLLQPDTSQQQHQHQYHHHHHHHHQQQQYPQQNKSQQAVVSLLPPSSASLTSTNSAVPLAPPTPSPEAVVASIMSSASKMILQHQAAGLLTPTSAQQYLEMMRTRAANYATAPISVHQKLLDDLSEELGKLANEGIEESVSKEVFSKYEYREILPGCLPHPGDIVEAGSLSSLFLPDPWYPLTSVLTPDKLDMGQLSSLQLEGILYACQKHQTVLPNGHRAGFFIGDGAGVGKGRQVSGIILDNFSRGRVRHIWFSISTDLVVDARRDLRDIGCHIRVIDGCNELDKQTRVFGLSPDLKEGVVFSTYATLVSSVQRGSLTGTRQSRLQQLINWCGGKDFDGCLIFDECHKAKNFVPGKEHASTKVANAVMTIQRLLPKARVIYCSATGVSDVKNMAFMERLGLWGDGAPFPSFENFLDCMARKGLGAAEMLAMEMKTSGMYVSRGLSFKQAEFVTVEAELTCEQMRTYDTAAYVWNELRKALITALHRTNCGNNRIWTQYWSSHQRFFKQLCMGMKVPTIVQLAKEALDQGHCVVIGLQTTGEASLESEMGRNKGVSTGFVSLCREILTRFIRVYFPTNIECGMNEPSREDDWCKEAKSMLLKYAMEIELPDSPLDAIIDQLGGPDKVAEMTGRRGRVVRHKVNGCAQYELRAGSGSGSNSELESLNVNERNRFMDGRKLIAIISDAASTGISLHADIRSDNRRRREHLTIELPWSADKAVQQLGRSHRSNQSSGPLYKLVTTNLGGERRFAAAVARRLQSLGALTKGDRRAATGADLTEFNFDTPYGRIALRTMYQYICISDLVPGVPFSAVKQAVDCMNFHKIMQDCLILMGIVDMDPIKFTVQVKKEDLGNVGKFLNRILGLPVMKQNLIFNYFIQCLDITIMNAKREGKYNEGLLDITASSVEMIGEPKEVFKDLTNGNTVTKLCILKIDRGMTWEAALNMYEGYTGKNDGFYLSKGKPFGRKLCLLALAKENSKHLFKVARPNTGVSLIEMEKSDIQAKYIKISLTEAKKAWQEQHEATEDHCMHGRLCRNRASCTVGSRCYRMHVLCGSIVTLMSVLEAVMVRHSYNMRLNRAESSIRVVRIRLNNGERVVGIRYPEQLIVEAETVLKEHQIVNRVQTTANCQSTAENIMTNFNTTPRKMVIEEVTPVVPKYLIKAFTPPVTMHNFFKSSRAGRSPYKIQKLALEMERQQQQQQQQQQHHHHHYSHAQPSPQLASSSPSCSLMQSHTQHSSSLSSSPSCSSSSSSSSSFVSCSNHDDVNVSCNNSRISSRNDRLKKRSVNFDNCGVSKKPRQSTITLMFKRQSEMPHGDQQVMQCQQCPVCNVGFQPGMNNDHINSHIDNCLL